MLPFLLLMHIILLSDQGRALVILYYKIPTWAALHLPEEDKDGIHSN